VTRVRSDRLCGTLFCNLCRALVTSNEGPIHLRVKHEIRATRRALATYLRPATAVEPEYGDDADRSDEAQARAEELARAPALVPDAEAAIDLATLDDVVADVVAVLAEPIALDAEPATGDGDEQTPAQAGDAGEEVSDGTP
jgi:hypothetical protein